MGDLSKIHGETIAVLFDEAAASAPDSIAVCCKDKTLTYGDLAERANRLGRFLLRKNVRRGDRVALLTGRSIDTIIAILGIAKAGAAYLPLDPNDPPHRRAGILAESAPAIVLVGDEVDHAADLLDQSAIPLRRAIEESGTEAGSHLPYANEAADLACVMYTSGSTGRPKGVLVPHRAVVRLVRDQDYAPFGADETVLHLAPLAFDASTFEIWGALLHGGRLAIVPEAMPSLDMIGEAIAQHGVTTAWFTSGLFSLLVDHRIEALRPLRCILAGGDVLSPAHVRRASAGLPRTRLVNGYGPTENTTFTCCYPIPRDGLDDRALPIGTPLRGTRVHLLDENLEPVRVGEVGQICCAGLGLALGYLGQPELTARAFVDIELEGTGRERVYLTGDQGRWRRDGQLEFCGRTDFQVKISGKRIELGDIENALRSDTGIADAVVVASNAPSGGKQIVAYVKPWRAWTGAHQAAQANAALARLRTLLPDYMVPAVLVPLDDFPLLSSGKVNRSALPAPVAKASPLRTASRQSAVEQDITAIWQRVLNRPDINRDTNFFDLGGTSLLLLAAHADLQATVAPKLSLVSLFEHTSVRALADFLQRADRPTQRGTSRSVMPLQRRDDAQGDWTS